jgi:hypothetical protein
LTYRDLQDELLATVVGLEGIENGRKLGGVEFNYCSLSASYPIVSAARRPIFDVSGAWRRAWRRIFGRLTIDDGTNDLVDLAMDGAVARKPSRGNFQASGDGRSEGAS